MDVVVKWPGSVHTELYGTYLCHDNSCRFVMFTCKKCTKLVGVVSLAGVLVLVQDNLIPDN